MHLVSVFKLLLLLLLLLLIQYYSYYLFLLLKCLPKAVRPVSIGNTESRNKYIQQRYKVRKVKFALEQAMKGQRGCRGIALLFL